MFFVGELFRVLFYVLFIGCFSFLFEGGARASVGDVEGEELVFDSSKVGVPLPAEVSVKKEVVPANVEKATVDDNFSVSKENALLIAKNMVARGMFDDALVILNKIQFDIETERDLELERWFLLGQIAMAKSDYDGAIALFRKILDVNPDLSRVRLDLSLAYMQTGSYIRANYNFRLAMAGDLPDTVSENVSKFLYILRANKNYGFWFNFGIAPDSNINNTRSGTQCVNTIFGVLCNDLPGAEDKVGYNFAFGGDYEFRLSERWRIKSDLGMNISKYDERDYDDYSVSASVGPRYIFDGGELYLGLSGQRRYLAHTPYSYFIGAKMSGNYDITQRLSFGASLYISPMRYDNVKALDGNNWGIASQFAYSLTPSKYMIFKSGYDREETDAPAYRNGKVNFGIGFGAELYGGYSIYLEPSVVFTNYDNPRPYIKDNFYQPIKRNDTTWKYQITLANKKINFYGFTPTFGYTYTSRNSNVWQEEYSKHSFNFGFSQRF